MDATTFHPNSPFLAPCKARGARLRAALHANGLEKLAVQAIHIGCSERSLSRWLNGAPIGRKWAERLEAILAESATKEEAKHVLFGNSLHPQPETESKPELTTPDTSSPTPRPIPERRAMLVRAYRWLPMAEKIHFADRVLSVPTLKQARPATGADIDGVELDDIESAMLAKLDAITDIAKEVRLISELIKEADAWRH